MIARTRKSLAAAPTPMAGLALGIASLGWCWENAGHFDGRMQLLGAAIAAVLLVILTFKFLFHPNLLMQELDREANTLGSKAIASEFTQASVELKVLIEQRREQVQNIE